MSERFAGTYFDGRSGRRHDVELHRVGTSHFALAGDGIERGGAIGDLSITPRLARVARTVEFADGARLLLAHDAAIDGWFPDAGRMESFVDRLERHAYAVAAAIFVCAAAVVLGAQWGLPRLADAIAAKIPADVDRSLGREVLSSLDGFVLQPSRLDAARRDELTARFTKLSHDAGGEESLEFRDAPGIGANAFAIPGGTVVVTDQLMSLLDDDREFDAIVAHEIGHQHYRHTLRQTLRGSIVAIIAAFVAGDVSSAGAVVAAVPAFLVNSHYSREFEAEADRFAFDLLAREGESPHWFAASMRELSATSPDNADISFLSSHPQSRDRIAAADAAARAFAAAHPDACPNGVCPGDDVGSDSCEDCDRGGSKP